MDKIIRALIGFSLLIVSGSVAATPITGQINIGGGSQVISSSTSATGIDYNCSSCGASVTMFGATPTPTGSFAGLGGLSTTSGNLTMYDFLFSNIPSQVIWDINYNGLLYSFTLTSVNIVSGNTGNYPALVLAGAGVFNISGGTTNYTATAGNWVYSQSGATFSSQSTVPEPGTIALLGLGLVGIGAVRRFRKAA